MKKFRVCKLDELTEGSAKAIKVFARQIAVFNINGTIRAVDGLCQHMKAPLVTSGKLDGAKLTCKMHGWEYDITTGECIGKPFVKLRQYDVEIENGDVFVRVEFDTA
ncbi:Rieske (2Fe-2S) protein [bacterium]|nr:MAG: Rieske (2Fe-2S) protein [bacterium]